MIVVITGMPRSGSTFTYNVARLALETCGTVYVEPTPDIAGAIGRAGDAQNILVKAHSLDALGTALVKHGAVRSICTVRNLVDSAASLIDVFGSPSDSAIASLKNWLAMYGEIKDASLVIPYGQVENEPAKIAQAIVDYILPNNAIDAAAIAEAFSKTEALRMSRELDPNGATTRHYGPSYFDTVTFMHRRHVETIRERNASERISLEDIARVQRALAPEIDLIEADIRGYKVE